jgi:uncharacterized protein (DUF362 family)
MSGDGHPTAEDGLARVALVRSDNRYSNVARTLELLSGEIDLSNRQRVLIKPNFVVTHKPLAATHVDAVRAVLDFVRNRYDGAITIAEGPSVQTAAEGFRAYGYEPLARTYDATLLDLNRDEPYPVTVYDRRLRPLRLHLAQTAVNSDFRISVGPPKTHDVVIVTLGLKNMIMGALISRHSQPRTNGNRSPVAATKKLLLRTVPRWVRRLPPVEWLQFRAMSSLEPSDKMKMHQSYPVINLNLALLAPFVAPHLSVIDAFEAMEGDGPTEGTAVPLHVAVSSTDALAADTVGSALMGVDIGEVGYLSYCRQLGLGVGDLERIELVGNTALADCAHPFRPHHAVHRQRQWRSARVEQFLRDGHPLAAGGGNTSTRIAT